MQDRSDAVGRSDVQWPARRVGCGGAGGRAGEKVGEVESRSAEYSAAEDRTGRVEYQIQLVAGSQLVAESPGRMRRGR